MTRYLLSLRMLRRDMRSGELSILFLALLIAVSSATAISLFADRLHRTMSTQAADFLAADLVIASPASISSAWLEKARDLKLREAVTVEFSSVLIENDQILLASIKAVSSNYPLRGILKASTADYNQQQTLATGPKAGNVWVEKRVMSALDRKIGDTLTVGVQPLKITRLLTYEPDKRGDLYSLSPRVMMNMVDLQATEVLQPGSHVHYFFQFSGEEQALRNFNHWLKPQLNASQRLMDIHEDRPELGSALSRAEKYLGLCAVVVVLIAGVAIAMATRRYSERHFDAAAIFRCLGYRQNEIFALYFLQLLSIGVLAGLIGCAFGWLLQWGLFYVLRELLPPSIAEPSVTALILGFATGLLTLLGFGLPPVLRLKKVSPLRVFRRDLAPLPASAWLVYLMALVVIVLLLAAFTGDVKMTLTITGSALLLLLLLGFVIHGLLFSLAKVAPRTRLSLRFGLQGLTRNRHNTVSQTLAFSLTLLAMLLSFSVRNDLLDDWRAKLPEQAPNHFALNIFTEQLPAFSDYLSKQNIAQTKFYPVVRGRLVAINGVAVQKIVSKDTQGERATHRDLSLTYSAQLPADNRIVAGQWWQSGQKNAVSVEQKLAKSLKIHMNDELTFTIGSKQIQANVSSIRSVQWDTMKPNFYMMFVPGALDDFAVTYITSFYLSEQQKTSLNGMVKAFPALTVLEVDLLIRQFRHILAQLTHAIDYLLAFAMLAGFMVLLAAVNASLDERIYWGTLMRTFGAEKKLLQSSQIIEFAGLGLMSGLLAVGMAEVVRFALYEQVLALRYTMNGWLILIVPLLSALLVGFAGCRGVRSVLLQSPNQVLRSL